MRTHLPNARFSHTLSDSHRSSTWSLWDSWNRSLSISSQFATGTFATSFAGADDDAFRQMVPRGRREDVSLAVGVSWLLDEILAVSAPTNANLFLGATWRL
ncbi:hypothetical protein CEP53_014046 [Fusarium sp. AF-6]|nr:hypothetical protein CEP53_014046 [Fusarium sp. AF-6]